MEVRFRRDRGQPRGLFLNSYGVLHGVARGDQDSRVTLHRVTVYRLLSTVFRRHSFFSNTVRVVRVHVRLVLVHGHAIIVSFPGPVTGLCLLYFFGRRLGSLS